MICMPEQQLNMHLQSKLSAQKYLLWSSWEGRKKTRCWFASIIHQSSSFFLPKESPGDMLPVLDDDYSAMYSTYTVMKIKIWIPIWHFSLEAYEGVSDLGPLESGSNMIWKDWTVGVDPGLKKKEKTNQK